MTVYTGLHITFCKGPHDFLMGTLAKGSVPPYTIHVGDLTQNSKRISLFVAIYVSYHATGFPASLESSALVYVYHFGNKLWCYVKS